MKNVLNAKVRQLFHKLSARNQIQNFGKKKTS